MSVEHGATILFVTNNYKPYSGGVVSSIDAFRRSLRDAGYKVVIVTLDFTGKQEYDPEVIRIACPIRFLYKQNPMAIPLQIVRPLQAVFKQVQPDIVHVHHPFLLCSAAVKIAKEYSLPTVFSHHSQYGMYAELYAPCLKKMARMVTEQYVKCFCTKVNAIIVPTQSVHRQLKKQKITTPLHVIPTGIAEQFICKSKPEKRKQKAIQLLTVARFRQEKNLFFILKALKKLCINFTFTLIGYGDLECALKHYAYTVCGFSKQQVRFVIAPSKDTIAQAYKDADLFLFASRTETQGIVFAESMAAGTPVIAYRAPGAKDSLLNGKNGFLVCSQYEMAERISQLFSDISAYTIMSNNAFKTSDLFSMEQSLHHLQKLYQSLYSRSSNLYSNNSTLFR